METNRSAAAAANRDINRDTDTSDAAGSTGSTGPRRYISDVALRDLSRVPDHRLTVKFIFEEFGITKRQLLRAYVSMELEDSREPVGTLCQWIERMFPEDLRTAIIGEGQERAIDGYNLLAVQMGKLNQNMTDLIAELRLVTGGRKPATTLHQV